MYDDYPRYGVPWANRKRIIPLKTYSGRIVRNRKPHKFQIQDVDRIIRKIDPPPDAGADFSWIVKAMQKLADGVLYFIDKFLFWMNRDCLFIIHNLIDGLMTTIIRSAFSEAERLNLLEDLIYRFIARTPWTIKIEKPKPRW